ncbi:cupin domain-containing protein [Streptomyces thermoviolaceus]|uniref:JmjC domain-containing protein n=1 Tax=Streptomyces thermoviolaceus TaxID=1952 RepID=UPI00386F45F7|nr:cupin domain-containing protein [Streptomyces thermoviolaceus]
MITSDRKPPRVRIINTAALSGRQEPLVPIHDDEKAGQAARMLPVDSAALRRCIGDEKEFTADIWGKRVHVTRGGVPASDLISVQDIDRLLTDQPLLRSDMIRLVRHGEILPRQAYLRSMREIYPRPVDHEMTENELLLEMLTRGVASAAEVTAAVRGGATLILQSAHWYHPPLTEFCRSLELALGRRCRANIYLTPVSSQGFGLHTDPHDVFVLQAFGEKQWHVGATPWERHNGHASDDPDETRELLLRPGDVLYLPKGTPHRANTLSARSGHVTISIESNSWREVLRTTLSRLVEDSLPAELLDAELPVGWLHDGSVLHEAAERFLTEARAAFARQEPEQVRSAHLQTFLAQLTDRIPGAFETDSALGVLGVLDTTRLRRRKTVPCALFAQPATRRIYAVLGRRSVSMPDSYEKVMRFVAGRSEFTPEELSFALDEPERLELCQALVDAHLLHALE